MKCFNFLLGVKSSWAVNSSAQKKFYFWIKKNSNYLLV